MKTINAKVAVYMVDAVEHMTDLKSAMEALRRDLWADKIDVEGCRAARKHCRRLISMLEMVEYCLRKEEAEASTPSVKIAVAQ
jgi:hypothetical protein